MEIMRFSKLENLEFYNLENKKIYRIFFNLKNQNLAKKIGHTWNCSSIFYFISFLIMNLPNWKILEPWYFCKFLNFKNFLIFEIKKFQKFDYFIIF